MKIPPFDASRHYDSDDMCLIILWSLDGEILKFNDHFLELPEYFWQVCVDCFCIPCLFPLLDCFIQSLEGMLIAYPVSSFYSKCILILVDQVQEKLQR